MQRDIHARDGQLRAISVFEKRPEQARVTHHGQAEVCEGLTCTYAQDGHSVTIDMPAAIGGDDQGPSPGYFGRAALCGCLAIGIKMAATREGVRLERVRVEIAQEFDNRGVLAMPGARSAPGDTRISIEIVSPEEEARIREMVERAMRHDPWYLAFRDAQSIATDVSIAQEVA
ncbi:OsmC family protein [Jannaschia seohaensis]|uniref:OsmC-like protein n=1 Tax=Jannaschia seohaensis TaxID=475081 RepID=A0A2Y8ZZ77_9RHOB|nr:OsmC family protein [Jannaschia seohaensis]PWJ21624.1 OsmC-like protein [Jannaschia seohaensis]SSA37414.1 OsmC-like protein [Jannaschia seohaensis]